MKILHSRKKKRFSILENGKEIVYLTYEYPDDAVEKRADYYKKGIGTRLFVKRMP